MKELRTFNIKKIYVTLLIITIITFILFALFVFPHGRIIKYGDEQNTNTVIEMLQYANNHIDISNDSHIKSIEYNTYGHDFKLLITYIEDGSIKKSDVIINGNNKTRDYFSNNGIDIQETIVKPFIQIYQFIFIILVIIGIYILCKKRSKKD